MKSLFAMFKLALLFLITLFSQHLFAQSFTNNFFQVDLFCYQGGAYKGVVSDAAARKDIVGTYGPNATSGKYLINEYSGSRSAWLTVNVAANYDINTPFQPINASYVVDAKRDVPDPKLVVFANSDDAGNFCKALYHACKLQYGGEDNEYSVKGGATYYNYTYSFGLYDARTVCVY